MIETKTVEAMTSNAASMSAVTPTVEKENGTSTNSKTSISFLVANFFCFLISTIIIRAFWGFEDASKALAFYGVYHRYGWNQVVHFFGVPGIIWSLIIFMVHVPLPVVGDESLNYAAFLGICYCLFYLYIDPMGAVLYAPVLYAMYASSMKIMQEDQGLLRAKIAAAKENGSSNSQTTQCWYGTGKAMKFALAVHVFCWYIQIHLGHKVIEGAQPAVLQSLGGALSVAPLFAFYEGLWLLGINKGLQESTQQLVDEYTQQICSEKGITAMKACQSLLLSE